MPLVFKYHQPGDDDQEPGYVDLGDEIVRWGEFALSQSAGLGEPAVSGLEIDDPYGELDIVGWRAFRVYESSAPSNSQLIYTGRVGDRGVKRMRSFGSNAVSRQWSLDLIDANWYLGNRVLVDQDSKRPDETGGDRLRWLLANAAHVYLNDHGNVQYPSNNMDANDYRGQTSKNVLDDIAVSVGYNYWVDVSEAHNDRELFFMNPDSDLYTSSIRISNDLADVDDVTTFAPGDDAELKRSPTRIAFGVYVPYAKGSVYVRKQSTGEAFAKVDQVAPNSNIKKEATARNYGTRFLNDNDEEDDKITCWFLVPAAQVNDLRHGHRMEAKFTHLPGYESFRYMRVLHRTITQSPESAASGVYRVDLELSPIAGAPGIVGHYWDSFTMPQARTIPITPVASGATFLTFLALRGQWSTGLQIPPIPHRNSSGGTAFTEIVDYPGEATMSGSATNDAGIIAHYLTTNGTETELYWSAPDPGTSGAAEVAHVIVQGTPSITSAQSDHLAYDSSAGGMYSFTGASVTPPAGQSAIIFGLLTQGSDFPNAHREMAAGTGWTVLHSEWLDGPSRWKPHPILVYKIVNSASGSYAPVATFDSTKSVDSLTVALSY